MAVNSVEIDGAKLFELVKNSGKSWKDIYEETGIHMKSFCGYRDSNRIPKYRIFPLESVLGITLDMIKPQEPKVENSQAAPVEIDYEKLEVTVCKAITEALFDFASRSDIQQFMKDVGTLAISSKRRDGKSSYTPRATRRSEPLTSPLMKDKLAEIDAEQRELAGKKAKN
jgi:hypothetical protein